MRLCLVLLRFEDLGMKMGPWSAWHAGSVCAVRAVGDPKVGWLGRDRGKTPSVQRLQAVMCAR